MKELHRKAIISGLLCLLLCGKAISTSVNDEDPSILNGEDITTPDSPSPSKETELEHIFVRTSTLTVQSLMPNTVKKEYEEGSSMSLSLMLAMIGVSVGTALALGTVAIIFIIRRRTATKNVEVSRKIAQRTNMYVIRNENYDLNKTLSGIPSATDIWREIKIDS